MSNMRFWPIFRRYLRDRLAVGALLVSCAAILALLCALMGAPMWGVLYGCALYGAVLAVAMAVDASRYVRRHAELCGLLQQGLFGAGVLPRARGLIEQDWRRVLLTAIDQSAGMSDAYARDRRERDEYAALWTHQIKVPIAAMRLLLQAEPDSRSLALGAELFKVEQYVDMSLGYARLNGPSSDFVLRVCDLNDIMKKTARRFAPLFIQKKLKLDYRETTLRALTDEKWLAFVLEQVLSNAVKYTAHGSVTMYADEQSHTITVQDTGIGIAQEDLPRVFDHGYTGMNGREDKRATGLGLYLSKRVMDKLGHRMRIMSEVGRGTRVEIDLTQEE